MSCTKSQACQICGTTERIFWCNQCHLTAYCSKEHQDKDWKVHQNNCNVVECLEKLNLHAKENEENMSSSSSENNKKVSPLPPTSVQQWTPKNSVKLEPFLPEKVTNNEKKKAEMVWMSLKKQGVCLLNDFLSKQLAEEVYRGINSMYDSPDLFVDGEVVKQGSNLGKERVRGDSISWVDESYAACPALRHLCKKLDKLVALCCSHGNYEIECRTKPMVACYPGEGARYKRHVDNPAGDGRLLTCLYYLNKDWDSKVHGGSLCLYTNYNKQKVICEPFYNRLCLFFSDNRNPHEVLPCFRRRFAITCWYFDNEERRKALENWGKREVHR